MKKILTIVVLLALCILASTTVFAGTVKIYPVADVYTDSSAPGTNFNNLNLRIGYDLNHGKHRSYMRFDLSPVQGKTITAAKLSLDPLFPINNPTANLYYMSSDTWNEASVNWNNAPSYSTTLIDSKPVTVGSRFELNVTSAINEPDHILSMALVSAQETTPNKYAVFYSKDIDTEDYRPYIEVTYEGGNPPPGECATQADTNCDQCVSLSEMINTIVLFKQGSSSLTLNQLINIIVQFKTGGISC